METKVMHTPDTTPAEIPGPGRAKYHRKSKRGLSERFGVQQYVRYPTRNNGLRARVSNMRHTSAASNVGESGLRDEVRPDLTSGDGPWPCTPRDHRSHHARGTDGPGARGVLHLPLRARATPARRPANGRPPHAGTTPAGTSSCPAPRASPQSGPGPPHRASPDGSCSWSPVRCARGSPRHARPS